MRSYWQWQYSRDLRTWQRPTWVDAVGHPYGEHHHEFEVDDAMVERGDASLVAGAEDNHNVGRDAHTVGEMWEEGHPKVDMQPATRYPDLYFYSSSGV